MTPTPDLIIFVLLAGLAIASAVMTLASRQAVYSALFLVFNFLVIAVLFLLLHAPFIALIQITVYAGAIMVLFLFVIMLLGLERLHTESKLRWQAPSAVVLALLMASCSFCRVRRTRRYAGERRTVLPVESSAVAANLHLADGQR